MKTAIKLLLLMLLLSGCVQKSYDRTVLYVLDTKGIPNVKTVGIRGNDNPLSWEKDYLMVLDPNDSLYKATVTTRTGYLFTEIKFVVNGEFEFKDQPNRKIDFEKKDTIVYKAVFNK